MGKYIFSLNTYRNHIPKLNCTFFMMIILIFNSSHQLSMYIPLLKHDIENQYTIEKHQPSRK
eukprot:UN03573